MKLKVVFGLIMVGLILVIVGSVSAEATIAGTSQTVDVEGWYGSIALDTDGIPHISYYSSPELRYASQNPDGSWAIETITSSDRLMKYPDLAISSTGTPYVSYSWWPLSHSRVVLVSRADDGTWTRLYDPILDLSSTLSRSSLALDAAGTPHISVETEIAGGGIAYISGSSIGEVIREYLSHGFDPSLALDAAGTPHISYRGYGGVPGEVKYASRNSDGTWTIEVIDITEIGPSSTSLAFDATGTPHISYYAPTELRYASRNSDGTWTTEGVNSQLLGMNGNSINTLAFDVFGVPHILYYNESRLQFSSRNSDGTWTSEVIDAANNDVFDLAFDDAGVAHICYTYGGALKYFRGFTEQYVAQEVLLFSESLTADDFKTVRNCEAYINKLNALADIIEAGNYTQAQDKIANDLMKRNEQWGTNPDALNDQLAIISAYITALQGA
jgi:hypothetical protein